MQNANLSEEGVKVLRQELEKFKSVPERDIFINPGRTFFFPSLTTEKNNLSVKTIQTAAQLEENKNSNNKIEEIQKYNVRSMLELDGKAEIEKNSKSKCKS